MDPSTQVSVAFAAFIAVLVGISAIPWEVFSRIDPTELADVRKKIDAIRDELADPIDDSSVVALVRNRTRVVLGGPVGPVGRAVQLSSRLQDLERKRVEIVTKIQWKSLVSAILFCQVGLLSAPLAWILAVFMKLSAAATFSLGSICSLIALIMAFRWLAGIWERRLAAEDDYLLRPVVWLFPLIAAASLFPFFWVAVPQLGS